MKGFTKWLVKHRIAVIILCIALMIPSVLGMAATKTKYDLLYYLPQDLETVQGQEILLQDFGKGAFSLLVTEGMSISDQADMENALKEIPHVDSVIGFASITKGMFPIEIIPSDIREMFQRGDCMLSAVFFDEGSSSEEKPLTRCARWLVKSASSAAYPRLSRIQSSWWKSRKGFTWVLPWRFALWC